MTSSNVGTLYIVATPIGNLKDITLRALEVLKSVDCIVAEDTRHSQPLLRNYSISTPMLTLHDHNEREFSQKILARLLQGQSVALISDAGTPLISDPGYFLVREARASGIQVVPLPGACAAIAALSVCGLATDRFSFEGFLPPKSMARNQRLECLKEDGRTLVFYEAPHRILGSLEAMASVLGGNRQAVMAREITKIFETIKSDTLEGLINFVKNDANQQRGEIVLIVGGCQESNEIKPEFENLLRILLENLPLKKAVEIVTKITGQKKNSVYQLALSLSKNSSQPSD